MILVPRFGHLRTAFAAFDVVLLKIYVFIKTESFLLKVELLEELSSPLNCSK